VRNGKFNLRTKYVIVVVLLALLAACGKKTDLIAYDDSAPEPVLVDVSSSSDTQTFHLKLDVSGGSHLLLYQVDRAEVDPGCQCIAGWLRYYESSLSAQRTGLQHHFKLQRADITYAFRVRVVDSLGRKTAWSKIMQTKVVSPP